MSLLRKTLGRTLGQRAFVLDEQAGNLLENFFISAVVSILVIRLYIRLFAGTRLTTQLTMRMATESTTADLHFAHVLWGGLLMLVAMVLALAYLGHFTRQLAAIVGGVGFGAFIDELGKFITVDNDYFFQPAIALIYLTLVLLFIVTRILQRPRQLSRRDRLANALEVTKLSVIGDASPEDRSRAQRLLAPYPNRDPVAETVRQTLQHIENFPCRRPRVAARARGLVARLAQRLINAWWFTGAVVTFFVFQSMGNLYQTLAATKWSGALAGWLAANALAVVVLYTIRHRSRSLRTVASAGIILTAIVVSLLLLTYQQETPEPLSTWLQAEPSKVEPGTGFQHRLIDLIEVLQLVSPIISNVLVVFGILFIWHSRLTAYHLFHHAMLVSILLTQVFVFHEDQLMGVIGLVPNLVVLGILRYLIRSEELSEEYEESETAPAADPMGGAPAPGGARLMGEPDGARRGRPSRT